ncbi:MAG: chromate transporter [Clostridia bacterium]|nr:chromate transporter [Clostridia bacterium]
MNVILALIYEFFKTGLFAVGGGLATLPFLYDIAARYDWLDVSIMPDMIAISESTPGPIGVNMATYCGYNAGFLQGGIGFGMLYGLAATLSLILPSLITIIIVARILDKFQNSTLVDNAFKGLRPAVCGLIASAALTVFASACLEVDLFEISGSFASLFDIKALVLFVLLFAVNKKFKLHPVFIIIPAAIVGIIFEM